MAVNVKQNMEIISTKSLVCIVAPCIKLLKNPVSVPDKALALSDPPRPIKFEIFRCCNDEDISGELTECERRVKKMLNRGSWFVVRGSWFVVR
jgi:hypothetical protein